MTHAHSGVPGGLCHPPCLGMDALQQAVINVGHEVRELATQSFPGVIEVGRPSHDRFHLFQREQVKCGGFPVYHWWVPA